ncbi:hypothetical protein HYFRA_00000369 [Hymenoscyphus fraxineus]|uniref:Protein kinase domain-containing protein n=1 Tax=Hymenoscyphus fraxineus TaxID=746836 RepID=A0A9N9PW80_9HELO|nr:hypothetical protein HYFRA_00000369 [Hymenoscyphus fraxineus]
MGITKRTRGTSSQMSYPGEPAINKRQKKEIEKPELPFANSFKADRSSEKEVSSSLSAILADLSSPPPTDNTQAQNPDSDTSNTQALWLSRAKDWNGISENWKPMRVLGSGSYGIVGLFEYIGKGQDMPKHMVVKQAPPGIESEALRSESMKLTQLSAAGAEHVVKIYKSFHRAAGTGADKDWDPSPWVTQEDGSQLLDSEKMVGRIYLEYAEGGDLAHANIERDALGFPEEVEVWKLINHLAKGAKELERGNKTNHVSGRRPIIHFDLRPHNGELCKSVLHFAELTLSSLADFGMSSWLPRHPQNPNWIATVEWRGATAWLTPEQAYRNHPQRQFGPLTNIWSIGATVFGFLHRSHRLENELFVVGWKKKEFISQEADLFGVPHSALLEFTLLQCLAFRPRDRISADTLIERSQAVMDYVYGEDELTPELLDLVAKHKGPSQRYFGERRGEEGGSRSVDIYRPFVEGESSAKLDDVDIINIGKAEEKETIEANEA